MICHLCQQDLSPSAPSNIPGCNIMSSRLCSHTPPGSSTNLPPTPPPSDHKDLSVVSRIVEVIRNRREGRHLTTTPWAVYPLDLEGYRELQYQLERYEALWDFVQNELRYDYFASSSRLVIRMPSDMHESYIQNINLEIIDQLRSVQGRAAEFANQIRPKGCTTLRFTDDKYSKHAPDAQFHYPRAHYPVVVIEVSYSQKIKDLPSLADAYILGSKGSIQVVVGLDIQCETGKEASLSVWRPSVITNEAGVKQLVAKLVVAKEVFRDTNGNLRSSHAGGLRLRLRDFAPEVLTGEDLRNPITITTQKLYSHLQLAEQELPFFGQPAGILIPTGPWDETRSRDSSPAEELSKRDERRVLAAEDRAEELAMRDDTSYKASSSEEEAS